MSRNLQTSNAFWRPSSAHESRTHTSPSTPRKRSPACFGVLRQRASKLSAVQTKSKQQAIIICKGMNQAQPKICEVKCASLNQNWAGISPNCLMMLDKSTAFELLLSGSAGRWRDFNFPESLKHELVIQANFSVTNGRRAPCGCGLHLANSYLGETKAI